MEDSTSHLELEDLAEGNVLQKLNLKPGQKAQVLLLDLQQVVIFVDIPSSASQEYRPQLNQALLRFARHFDLVVPLATASKVQLIDRLAAIFAQVDGEMRIDYPVDYTLPSSLIKEIAGENVKNIPFMVFEARILPAISFNEANCGITVDHVHNLAGIRAKPSELLNSERRDGVITALRKNAVNLGQPRTQQEFFVAVDDGLKRQRADLADKFAYTYAGTALEEDYFSQPKIQEKFRTLTVGQGQSYYFYLFQHFCRVGPLRFDNHLKKHQAQETLIADGDALEQAVRQVRAEVINYLVQHVMQFHKKQMINSYQPKQIQQQVEKVIKQSRYQENSNLAWLDFTNAAAVQTAIPRSDNTKLEKIQRAVRICQRLDNFFEELHQHVQNYLTGDQSIDLFRFTIERWQNFKKLIDSDIIAVIDINQASRSNISGGQLLKILEKTQQICSDRLSNDNSSKDKCIVQ